MGKTTCAAALALASAAARSRTLLITTDPAPSLGDALGQPLSGSPRPVPGTRGLLHALEIDPEAAAMRWLAPRRDALETIAERGTWLDRDDVAALLRLSIPGIDEVAALLELSRYLDSGRYDLVIVDTAPTGHTLRMLAMPDVFRAVASAFQAMQARHRLMVEVLGGRAAPDSADDVLEDLERQATRLAELLRDPARSVMTWITLPEPLSVAETADALAVLERCRMTVDRVVVNRLTPPRPASCRWCAARRGFETQALERLSRVIDPLDVPVSHVPAQAEEPRGPRALKRLVAHLSGPADTVSAGRRPGPRRAEVQRRRVVAKIAAGSATGSLDRATSAPPAELVLFGGKGGVGKTTCAAAVALALAAANADRRVLLLSTDPAHSLGDVLQQTIGDTARRVARAPANLLARELDAGARWTALRARFEREIEALFARTTGSGGIDAPHDREVMRQLLALAPPGIDELAAILEVSDALVSTDHRRFDRVVMDTAPSGHALRLLEMPAKVHAWVKALMGILLKYRPVAGLGDAARALLQLSRELGRLRDLLGDGERTRFVAVTRPGALPHDETARLLPRIRSLGITTSALIVNAVGAGTCTACARERRTQSRRLRDLAALGARHRVTVTITPAVVPPPTGPAALRAWRRTWRGAAVSSGSGRVR